MTKTKGRQVTRPLVIAEDGTVALVGTTRGRTRSVDAQALRDELAPHADNCMHVRCDGRIALKGDARGLFENFAHARSIDLTGVNTRRVTGMGSMFAHCTDLVELTLPATFDTSSVRSMRRMFSGCRSLEQLRLPDAFDMSSVEDAAYMLAYCRSLIEIETHGTLAITPEDEATAFHGCRSLDVDDALGRQPMPIRMPA